MLLRTLNALFRVGVVILMVLVSVSVGTSAVPRNRLVIGMGGIAEDLNPHMSTAGLAMSAYYALFDTLTYIDARGRLQPALATSWEQLDDRTWRFTLRQGVQFHNGEPFNANAVKFSIEKVLDPTYQARVRGRISLIRSVEASEPSTVIIRTRAPDPLLPKRLSVIFMIPPTYFQAVGPAGFARRPVGTGAFRFRAFSPGNSIALEASNKHWRGSPRVQEVTMLSMPEGSARVNALKTGEIDIAGNLPLDQIRPLQAAGFKVQWVPLARTHVITFRSVVGGPIANRLVRQALNHAVDKEALIRNLMLGYARPANGQLVGPDGFGFNPGIKDYEYNPQTARRLLAEAGYPNGFDLKIQTTDGRFINDKPTVEAAAGYLNAVGVRARIEVIEGAVYTPMILDGKAGEAFFLGWNYFPVLDADFALGWFHCRDSQQMFCRSEYDELLFRSRSEMNSDGRLRLLQQMARFAYDDPIAIFLFRPADVFGLNQRVQGFRARFDTVISLDGLSVSR